MKPNFEPLQLIPKRFVDGYRAYSHARSTFIRFDKNSSIHVPQKIPKYIRLYLLYVAAHLHKATLASKSRKKVFLGLPKHLEAFPTSWRTVVLQIEQAVYTGESNSLSPEGLLQRDEDPAISDVLGSVRLHGPRVSFENASAVVDYSALNVEKVRKSPSLRTISSKFHVISPLLGPCSRELRPREEVIVATMYGSPNRGRRGRIATTLAKAGIEVLNVQNFENYETAFQDIAILLNFRQVEHFSTPEELRILPALLQGVVVIMEDTSFARQSLCAEFLVFADERSLSATIKEVQSNYSTYWNQIFENDRFADFVRDLEVSNHSISASIMRTVLSDKP